MLASVTRFASIYWKNSGGGCLTGGVGKIGKDRAYISASAPKELVALIDARAEALGWSRAQFTVAILDKWRVDGAPAVGRTDETMRAEVMSKFQSKARKSASR